VAKTALKASMVLLIAGAILAAGAFLFLNPFTQRGDNNVGTTLTTFTSFMEFVENHMSKFRERNVASILTDYLDDATLIWRGESGGLSGTYKGVSAIRTFLSVVLTGSENVNVEVEKVTSTAATPQKATVKLDVKVSGYNFIIGHFEGKAEVSLALEISEGSWRIKSEEWNYSSFSSESPGSTAFPQWATLKGGRGIPTDPIKDFVYNYSSASIIPLLMLILFLAFLVFHGRRPKDLHNENNGA